MTATRAQSVGTVSAAQMPPWEGVPTDLLLGEWRPAGDGRRFEVVDPYDGAVLAQVADASPADALAALGAAHAVQPEWQAQSPRARAAVLRGTFELVTERGEQLAALLTAEMGKPLHEARAEVAYAADYLHWYAEEALRLDGRTAASPDGRSRVSVVCEPVGPCLLITPWNFPLAMIARKVAPALAAGCTVVLKPAELTPLSALALAELLREAGAPTGVVNVVTTTDPAGVAAALTADSRLRKVSFTGSTPVGRLLLGQCADNVLRASLELGGNAPLIVFDDADLDRAVEGALVAKLRNSGQSCVAANRLLVHERIADAFVERFARGMEAAVVGAGTDPATTVGPLIHAGAARKASELVADAIQRGARLVVGGDAPGGPAGACFPPTVLDAVPRDARVLHEEIFGPVAPIVRFASEQEALELANATPFGLAAYVFTESLARATRLTDGLEVGMVALNQGLLANVAAPFGGVKQSGLGREGGHEGLLEYASLKYVSQALT